MAAVLLIASAATPASAATFAAAGAHGSKGSQWTCTKGNSVVYPLTIDMVKCRGTSVLRTGEGPAGKRRSWFGPRRMLGVRPRLPPVVRTSKVAAIAADGTTQPMDRDGRVRRNRRPVTCRVRG